MRVHLQNRYLFVLFSAALLFLAYANLSLVRDCLRDNQQANIEDKLEPKSTKRRLEQQLAAANKLVAAQQLLIGATNATSFDFKDRGSDIFLNVSIRHPEVHGVFNPALAQLRNGSVFTVFRVSSAHWCLGFEKMGMVTDGRHGRHYLYGGVVDGGTLARISAPFRFSFPRTTRIGSTVRCDIGGEDSGDLDINLQDPRLFWWGDRLMLIVSIGNCEDAKYRKLGFGVFWSSTRLYMVEISQSTLQPKTKFATRVQPDTRPKDHKNWMYHKNWVPFTVASNARKRPDLYLEYQAEPRVVLRFNRVKAGVAYFILVKPVTSNVKLFMQQTLWKQLLHGSSPAVQLLDGNFLGLAHTTVTSHLYEHVFYLYEGRPPFRILGFSQKFHFPAPGEMHDRTGESFSVAPMIQFVTGMLLQGKAEGQQQLLIGVSQRDCFSAFVEVELSRVLASIIHTRLDHLDAASHYDCKSDMDVAFGQNLRIGGMLLGTVFQWWSSGEPYANEAWTKAQCCSVCASLGLACTGFVIRGGCVGEYCCWFKNPEQGFHGAYKQEGVDLCIKRQR